MAPDWAPNDPGESKGRVPGEYEPRDYELPENTPDAPAGPNNHVAALVETLAQRLEEAGRSVSAAALRRAGSLDAIRRALDLPSLRSLADRYLEAPADDDPVWEAQPFDQREIVSPIHLEAPLEEQAYPEEIYGPGPNKERPSAVSLSARDFMRPIFVLHATDREGLLAEASSGEAEVWWFDGGRSRVPVAETLWALSFVELEDLKQHRRAPILAPLDTSTGFAPGMKVRHKGEGRIGVIEDTLKGKHVVQVHWHDGQHESISEVPVSQLESLDTMSIHSSRPGCPHCGVQSKDLIDSGDHSSQMSGKAYCQNCRKPFRLPVSTEHSMSPVDSLSEDYEAWSDKGDYLDRVHWSEDATGRS